MHCTMMSFLTLTSRPDIRAHYSDAGVLSRQLILQHFQNEHWLSIHMASGTELFMQLMFFVQICFAVCMILGYRTKLSTFATWY